MPDRVVLLCAGHAHDWLERAAFRSCAQAPYVGRCEASEAGADTPRCGARARFAFRLAGDALHDVRFWSQDGSREVVYPPIEQLGGLPGTPAAAPDAVNAPPRGTVPQGG